MLTWKVYCGDFNAGRIDEHNIFDHAGFYDDCVKAARKHKDDRSSFEDEIKRSLRYYYWSKCEWEIILSGWPPSDRFRAVKIDVFDQIMLNWPVFINWLWENRKELKKK